MFFFFKSKCKSLHRFIKKQLEFKKWNKSIKSKQKTDIWLKVNQPSNRTVTKHWMISEAITWQLMSCVLIMHEHYYLVSRGNNSRWQKGHIFSQWRSYWALYLSSFVKTVSVIILALYLNAVYRDYNVRAIFLGSKTY